MNNDNIEFDKDILLFTFRFNKEIGLEIINEYVERKIKKIIFNNYNEVEKMYSHSNDYIYDYKKKTYSGENNWRGSRFNKSIDEFSKIDLKHLVLGAKFNQEIRNLPNSLESLILGIEFNQELNNLPCGLKILCCKNCIGFSHNLDYLPESLEYIVIPPNFDNSLNNLPNSIRILDLYHICNCNNLMTKMLTILPANLETIIIEDFPFYNNIITNLMNNFNNKYNNKIQVIYDKLNCFTKIIS